MPERRRGGRPGCAAPSPAPSPAEAGSSGAAGDRHRRDRGANQGAALALPACLRLLLPVRGEVRRAERSVTAAVCGRLAAPHGDRELLQRGRLRALLGERWDGAGGARAGRRLRVSALTGGGQPGGTEMVVGRRPHAGRAGAEPGTPWARRGGLRRARARRRAASCGLGGGAGPRLAALRLCAVYREPVPRVGGFRRGRAWRREPVSENGNESPRRAGGCGCVPGAVRGVPVTVAERCRRLSSGVLCWRGGRDKVSGGEPCAARFLFSLARSGERRPRCGSRQPPCGGARCGDAAAWGPPQRPAGAGRSEAPGTAGKVRLKRDQGAWRRRWCGGRQERA